jgi:hypothetical protein
MNSRVVAKSMTLPRYQILIIGNSIIPYAIFIENIISVCRLKNKLYSAALKFLCLDIELSMVLRYESKRVARRYLS